MALHNWYDILDRSRPMASARIVRREKYAWPGGYELALVMSDGALICAKCVEANWHKIASATLDHRLHRTQCNGWEPQGIASADEAEQPEVCEHCGATIFEGVGD